MRTLRWGMSGDDVAELQGVLADLGYYRGAADGHFGAQTRSAVLAFQRAQGLPADGVAGPVTLTALGLGGAPATTPTKPGGTSSVADGAISVHIGLNRVDPSKYGGWSGPLSGCEHDASTMTAIGEVEGFAARQLFTRDATSENVLSAISDAARQLRAGDMFLLTYAGHGGQVPNVSADPEADQQDETWVLYDRMLLDDELSEAFVEFQPGVNLVLLSDSCHSGTIYRVYAGSRAAEYAMLKRSFYENLALGRDPISPLGAIPHPATAAPALMARGRFVPQPIRSPQQLPGGVGVLRRPVRPASARAGNGGGNELREGGVRTREMPFDVNERVVRERAAEFSEIQERVRSRGEVMANGVSISGCQDNQLSQEVGGAGVFTTTLARVWADNGFTGSYEALHAAIVGQMGPNQTPVLGLFGGNPDELLARTPFNP